MKAIFIVILIVVTSAGRLQAQINPMFETTIYVVDAIGNMDSVVIGYDLNANAEYNPQFGEFDIIEPFDSVFEVRAGHGLDYQGLHHDIVLSNRIIGGIEPTGYIPSEDCYDGREPIILFIHALYRPVTVYWDSTAFDTTWCTRGSMISSHDAHLATPWWVDLDIAEPDINLVERTSCMVESDSFIDGLFLRGWDIGIIQPIQGLGMDTVFGIMVTALHEQSMLADWCGDGVVQIYESEETAPLAIFPNPVKEDLYFDRTVTSFVLYSFDGYVVKTGQNSSSVDMSMLQSGFYVLQIKDRSSKPVTLKILRL